MCVITARISLDGLAHSPAPEVEDIEVLKKQPSKSLDRIAHRGLDSNGTWISPDGVVGKSSFLLLSYRAKEVYRLRALSPLHY